LAFASACRKANNKWYCLIGPLAAFYAVPLSWCPADRPFILLLPYEAAEKLASLKGTAFRPYITAV
jgi:hypothetical protein